jgi:omega-amidase
MKIAAAQISCVLGEVPANLAKVCEFAQRAKQLGVEMILFPEMADTGYSMPVIREHATSWEDGAVSEIQKIAAANSIAIVAGVSEREEANIFNSQVVIDTRGDIIGKYRKTHLFTPAPIEEHTCFSAGVELTSFPFAGMQFGLSICYDLRFPEVYRTQAIEHAANVFLISSAWPFPRFEHLRTLALARAIENQSYVILSNRVGADAGITFCGSSAIIDPYGVTIASASSDREEMLVAEVSSDVLEATRKRAPYLEHRRPELYRPKKS